MIDVVVNLQCRGAHTIRLCAVLLNDCTVTVFRALKIIICMKISVSPDFLVQVVG